jgi:glucose-1-phosphate thymidylyltransferase
MAVSKQLMPVYDKPMVYYPLSILMLADIREVLVISTPQDLPLFKRLLGDGGQFGLKLDYAEQASPDGLAQALVIGEAFLDGAPSCLILGDNLFYGHDLVKVLEAADRKTEGSTIFGYHVANPRAYGVVEFDAAGKVLSIEEKPDHPKSNYAVPGLYFYDEMAPAYAKALQPSPRGEYEITDLNRRYLEEGKLTVELFGRGTAWLDTGTHAHLQDAASFVQVIEDRQGLKIACLEEIAFEKGWIDEEILKSSVEVMGKSSYATYLRRILDGSL